MRLDTLPAVLCQVAGRAPMLSWKCWSRSWKKNSSSTAAGEVMMISAVLKAFDRQDISEQFPGRVEDDFTDSSLVSHALISCRYRITLPIHLSYPIPH